MYVIVWRAKGKFVAHLNSFPSYTKSLEYAHRFNSRDEAETNRLTESEVVMTISEAEAFAARRGAQ